MNEKKLFGIFPYYSVWVLIVFLIIHFAVFSGTGMLLRGVPHHGVELPLDELVPLMPEYVLVYVATFIFWAIGLWLVMTQERELCFRMFAGCFIAEIICCAFFVLFPTEMTRPEIVGDKFYHIMLRQIYAADGPTNLFPSMHCLFSYMVFRQCMISPKVKWPYSVASGFMAAVICASTVLVKQHVVLDIAGGIFFGELALQLGMRTKAWRILDRLNKKILHNK